MCGETLEICSNIIIRFLFDAQAMLTDQIRRIANRPNFRPFKLRTSSGNEFSVFTRDHISFGPFGVAIGVWNEQGTACTWLSAATITDAVDEDPLAS
jgi:hypothetical protein